MRWSDEVFELARWVLRLLVTALRMSAALAAVRWSDEVFEIARWIVRLLVTAQRIAEALAIARKPSVKVQELKPGKQIS